MEIADMGNLNEGKKSGMLYLVPTPIGNLGDITLRALEVLRGADGIACEDTRRTLVLLNHFGIKKPLRTLHKFNEDSAGARVVADVLSGMSIAYVSDAGVPGISDPGTRLVRLCIEQGAPYTVLPGASAVLTALVLSGFPSESFTFLGFLPEKRVERERLLKPFLQSPSTLIFYSAPHDVRAHADYLHSALGSRAACAVKEISKLHERASFFELGDPFPEEQPRGEYVLLVEGAPPEKSPLLDLSPEEHLKSRLDAGLSPSEAVKLTSRERGVHKSEIYRIALQLKERERE